jgi:hypothetical protein
MIKRWSGWLSALGAILLVGSGIQAAPLTLVSQGRSDYAIYHDPAAPASVKAAAGELQTTLQKATTVKLPVVHEPRERMLALGDSPAAQAAGIKAQEVAWEGYRLVTRGQSFFIVGRDTPDGGQTPLGGTSHGTRNGVYTFLERFVGVRWLMPGPDGEDIPGHEVLTVPDTDLTEAPFLLNRRLPYIQNPRPDVKTWEIRQKLGVNLALYHGHNWHSIPATAFREHPEWFAEIGGIRVPPTGEYKLCVTNPGLVQAFAERAIAFFDANPTAVSYSLSPSDGGGWCRCKDCTARYETDPRGQESVTPAILHFYNDVAKIVARKYPEKVLAGYVYAAYVFPPQVPIKLEPNVFLIWAPSFCYGYTLFRPDMQQLWDSLVGQWAQVTDRVAYYDLPTSVSNTLGAPNPPGLKILKFLYPRIKSSRMKGVYVYGNAGWGHAAVSNYLLAKLAWDPDADIDALFDEFMTRAYGEGADEIKAFYRLLDDETEKFFIANEKETYTLTDKRLKELYAARFEDMERLYRAAEAKVKNPQARARLSWLGENLTVLHWNLRHLKLLAEPEKSSFFLTDAAFTPWLNEREKSAALAPLAPPQRQALDTKTDFRPLPRPAVAQKLERFRFRGNQRLVLLPVGEGPAEVRFSGITSRGGLPTWQLYDAAGTRVAHGVITGETAVTLPAGPPQVYQLTISAGSASFSLSVKGASWAAFGRVADQGLHFLQTVSPLYFEVPEGVSSYHLWLAASPPGETALATLYAPDGSEVSRFDCSQKPIDWQKIAVKPGQAGVWKLVISEAPTGVLDDVWVKPGEELPGYFSLDPDALLGARVKP